jgi:hypothetical protein
VEHTQSVACDTVTTRIMTPGRLWAASCVGEASVSETDTAQDDLFPLKYMATKPMTAKNAVNAIAATRV